MDSLRDRSSGGNGNSVKHKPSGEPRKWLLLSTTNLGCLLVLRSPNYRGTNCHHQERNYRASICLTSKLQRKRKRSSSSRSFVHLQRDEDSTLVYTGRFTGSTAPSVYALATQHHCRSKVQFSHARPTAARTQAQRPVVQAIEDTRSQGAPLLHVWILID